MYYNLIRSEYYKPTVGFFCDFLDLTLDVAGNLGRVLTSILAEGLLNTAEYFIEGVLHLSCYEIRVGHILRRFALGS